MVSTRNTPQKKKIIEYLKSVKTHPTAEMVYEAVAKSIPHITLATVYRNLNQMAERGEILRLEIGKEYHYDACIEKHQHCLCKKCGKIVDSMQESITKNAISKLDLEGFQPESVTITFKGICADCKAHKNKGGKPR